MHSLSLNQVPPQGSGSSPILVTNQICFRVCPSQTVVISLCSRAFVLRRCCDVIVKDVAPNGRCCVMSGLFSVSIPATVVQHSWLRSLKSSSLQFMRKNKKPQKALKHACISSWFGCLGHMMQVCDSAFFFSRFNF